MIRLANFPKLIEVWPLSHSFKHVLVKANHILFNIINAHPPKRGVNVTDSFFNGSVISDSVKLLMFILESLVIVHPLSEFRRYTNNIPIIGNLLGNIIVQPERSTPQLVHGHGGRHRSKINEHVYFISIPALAQEPSSPHETPSNPPLEKLCKHLNVNSGGPVGTFSI